MNRFALTSSSVLAAVLAVTLPVAAETLEYNFTVPLQIAPAALTGPAAAPGNTVSVSCAVGGSNLGFSTATGTASNSTGSGTTDNVPLTPNQVQRVSVVVTVDAAPRTGTVESASALLASKQPSGYYTCWAKFKNGTTPINFLQTAKISTVPGKV